MPPSAARAGSVAFLTELSSPDGEFTLDLEAYNEEEDRHQSVIDQMLERFINVDDPATGLDVGVEQAEVAFIPG